MLLYNAAAALKITAGKLEVMILLAVKAQFVWLLFDFVLMLMKRLAFCSPANTEREGFLFARSFFLCSC